MTRSLPEHIELGWNPTPGMVSVAISELRRKIATLEQRLATGDTSMIDRRQISSRSTRIFFDTEFIEDGKTIELISIGLVIEDGRSYYAEAAECDHSRAGPWVQANVLTQLVGGDAIKPRAQIAADLIYFAGEKPEFWAYYADYDWVVLCQLFGQMLELPKGWPMYCRDIKQLCDSLGNPKLPDQRGGEHNALSDAQQAMRAWQYLMDTAGR